MDSGACTWNPDITCCWSWLEMVWELDDTIVRDGFTDFQFIFKGQTIEACFVSGKEDGFSFVAMMGLA